jgi:multidrug efflux pump subunit AcrA (membrane-fusion protein)
MSKLPVKEARALAEAASSAGVSGVTMIVGGKAYRVQAIDEGEVASLPVAEPAFGKEGELLMRFADELRKKVLDRSEEERLQRIEASLADLAGAVRFLGEEQRRVADLLAAPVVAEYDENGRVVSARRQV